MAKKVIGDFNFFDGQGDIIDRLTHEQLKVDKIKADTDFLRLLGHFGIKVSKTGKNTMALCPFHDDKTPSLSINVSEGLFKCFGCDKKGDVVKFVEYYKGIKFIDALKYLDDFNTVATESQRTQREDTEEEGKGKEEEIGNKVFDMPLQQDKGERLATESQSSQREDTEEEGKSKGKDKETPRHSEESTDKSILLDEVVKRYHDGLFGNKAALDYLKSRGFSDLSLLGRFKIGFCDGKSLLSLLSVDQKKSLMEIGILNKNGYESFNNCLIFPIFDDNDRVVGVYGRNIDDSSKFKHLYLPGKHLSVFNRRGSKVYDEVILTESIIDALSLVQLGINNVQACYGVNGFTDEMLQILKEDNVKTVVIAFDNDKAGKKGAEKLKDRLINENFTIKVIYPSSSSSSVQSDEISENKCNDWNEALVKGISKEDIKKIISGTEVFKIEKKDKISFKVKGDTYYFTADILTYRVFGFKGTFTTELKLNFRTYIGDKSEKDKKSLSRVLNLYSDKAVELYIRAISEDFGFSQEIIKGHFDKMIEIFEDERERILDEKGKNFDKQIYILKPSEEKNALDILTGSDLIHDHLLPDTEKIGLVGEKSNKIICYHAIISRLWKKPVNIFTVSMYGMGKSFLHDTMHRFVPDEDLKDYSRITKNDLYYREEENAFVGKILSIDEVEGIADSLYSIRTLISKGYLSISYPTMDPVSGKMIHEENKVFGRPSVFVTGTTDDRIDEETLSRFAVCTTDASNDQRLKIKQRQFFEMTRTGLNERRMEDEIVTKHKNILRMIKKIEVVFPDSWHKKLLSLENGDYSPRNHQCYLSFIASSAIREQYNRKIYIGDDRYGKFRYVEITCADIVLANKIMLELFGRSVRDLKPPQMLFFNKFQELAKKSIRGKKLNMPDVSFYEKDIRDYTKLSYWQVNRYLNDLVRMEYVGIDSRGKFNQKKYNLLIDNLSNIEGKYLNGLINPDTL